MKSEKIIIELKDLSKIYQMGEDISVKASGQYQLPQFVFTISTHLYQKFFTLLYYIWQLLNKLFKKESHFMSSTKNSSTPTPTSVLSTLIHKRNFWYIVGSVLIVLILAGGYLYYQSAQQKSKSCGRSQVSASNRQSNSGKYRDQRQRHGTSGRGSYRQSGISQHRLFKQHWKRYAHTTQCHRR